MVQLPLANFETDQRINHLKAKLKGQVLFLPNVTSVGYPGNETDHTALLAIKGQLSVPYKHVLSSWNESIEIKGTIGYAAPEYGLGCEPSTEGDVYSYGILLLELMTGKSPTNNMFKEGYSLHSHARGALPDQVVQIVDPSLDKENLTEEGDDTSEIKDELQRRVECIAAVITVGVLCSNHLPQERLKIVNAIGRLQSARDNLLNAINRGNLPIVVEIPVFLIPELIQL